jgi:hypothetical protein
VDGGGNGIGGAWRLRSRAGTSEGGDDRRERERYHG